MEIEQINGKKPNFLLVLILFCATILGMFVLAYIFLHFDGKHITFRHHDAHPTSRLILPSHPASTLRSIHLS